MIEGRSRIGLRPFFRFPGLSSLALSGSPVSAQLGRAPHRRGHELLDPRRLLTRARTQHHRLDAELRVAPRCPGRTPRRRSRPERRPCRSESNISGTCSAEAPASASCHHRTGPRKTAPNCWSSGAAPTVRLWAPVSDRWPTECCTTRAARWPWCRPRESVGGGAGLIGGAGLECLPGLGKDVLDVVRRPPRRARCRAAPARTGTSGVPAVRGRSRPRPSRRASRSAPPARSGRNTSRTQRWASTSGARREGVARRVVVLGGHPALQVVQEPAGLVLLGVQAGQPQQLALVVARVHDLRHEGDRVARSRSARSASPPRRSPRSLRRRIRRSM